MIEWVKEHPYLSGTLVVLLFVLFLVFRRSGGGNSAGVTTVGPSESLQAAQLSAGLQAQQIQNASAVQIAGFNAAVNNTQLQMAGQTKLAEIAAQVQLQNILTGGEVQDTTTGAQLTLGLASLGVTQYAPAPKGGFDITFGRAAAIQQNGADQSGAAGTVAGAVGNIPGVTLPSPMNPAAIGNVPLTPADQLPVPGRNQSYADYIASFGTLPANDFNPQDVAAHVALITSAQNAWVTDPCSPHNYDPNNPDTIPVACGGSARLSGGLPVSLPTVGPANPPTSKVGSGSGNGMTYDNSGGLGSGGTPRPPSLTTFPYTPASGVYQLVG